MALIFFFSNFSSLQLTKLIGLQQLLNFAILPIMLSFSCSSPNSAPVFLLLQCCEPTGWVLTCISFHGSPRTDTLFPGSCVFLFFLYIHIFSLPAPVHLECSLSNFLSAACKAFSGAACQKMSSLCCYFWFRDWVENQRLKIFFASTF